jgi:hypothetical protein
MIKCRAGELAVQAGLTPTDLIRRAGVSPRVGLKLLNSTANGRPDGPPLRSIHTPSLVAMAKVLKLKDPLELLAYVSAEESDGRRDDQALRRTGRPTERDR